MFLPLSFLHIMHSFWRDNKHAALQKMAHEATSLTMLQATARTVNTSNIKRSPSVIFTPHQVVSRMGWQVTSTQYRIEAVDENQS